MQITGKVTSRSGVEALKIQPVGDSFDLALYGRAVKIAMGEHRDLFV